ncbi:Ig-like domain-containing protein [Shimia isoporae]|uniref:Ig-like domain-containing protein n=1 Tax=Shimia isoporae TaxID=647720 RepID=A0A4R1NLT9_9RHOB|nr:Ig-like domain-containing protein [Shimia isoporae]TCL09085.1 Ig-like domain-containing protein [Shimia isoporae]
MNSFGYAVRGADGGVVRGQSAVSDHGIIAVSQASEVSLNLSPMDVTSYTRQGGDLVVTLASGETITLQGYFTGDMAEDRDLYLSKDGQFHKVEMGEPVGDQYFVQYDTIPMDDKWSEYDDLAFLDLERIEPVVAPIAAAVPGIGTLLGLGGAAAASALVSGGGDDSGDGSGSNGSGDDDGDTGGGTGGGSGGGGTGAIVPTVDDPDVDRIIGGTGDDTVTITGTGEAGSVVVVNVGGATETVTIDDSGTWEVVLDPSELPADGVYDAAVTVTAPDGTVYNLDGPTVDIDTTAPDALVTEGTQSVGEVVNADERDAGHVITGTGEPGASIDVEIDGTTHSTTVANDGSWSVTFASGEIATGEYETAVTITSTDARGNATTVTDILEVDTIAPGATLGVVEGDNVINAAEASDGVVLTGTGEPGSSLTIDFQGLTRTVTVGNSGAWSMSYSAAEIVPGTYDSDITLTATDAAGNSSTQSFTVHVDTVGAASITSPIAGDDIANAAEVAAGLTLTGTAEAGSQVAVTVEGVTRNVLADNSGNWTASWTAAEIPSGTYDSTVTVTATDPSGNSTTVSETFTVDTEISAGLDAGQLGGDNTANAAEQASGITLTGTADAGAQVLVTLEGVTRTVMADGSGNWTANWTAAEVPAGTYDSTVTVVATDPAGNSTSTTGTVHIDTEVSVGYDSGQAGGDDIANAADVAGGVVLTGTADPGTLVQVTLAGVTRTVTATAGGTWSAAYSAADIPQGEYDAAVSVTGTDAAGNLATTSGTLRVDTSTAVTVDLNAAMFTNPVNAAQMQGGLVMDGTAEPGATVSVTVEGVTRTTTADASGNWFVTYESGSLPEGTYTANATLSVTDVAGNTASTTATFEVDTEITTPIVQSVTFAGDDVTSVSLTSEDQTYEMHALNQDGSTAQLATTEVALGGDESLFVLNPRAADGTHLVISSEDAAGNESDTLLVLDDNVTNSGTLDHAALGNFNIEALELDYASDTSLTLTESQIRDLSDTSDTLTIHGGSDDQVTVSGATNTGQTVDIEGETYDIYTVGDDGVTLVIDQDINVIV